VAKDFEQIIKEIKIEDENLIHQKDIPSTHLDSLIAKNDPKEKVENKIYELDSILGKNEKESSLKAKEEPKNEINDEKEEEEPKEKAKKKKKKNHKKKAKKSGKIFEIPQTNPYRNLFDFKEFSKSRFQDNSIFRLINNWEEKDWFQTTPPTKDIDEQFPTQIFPQGEIQPYLKYFYIL